MVLVRLGGDRRVKKIMRKPKWSRSGLSVIILESESGNKRTRHQKRVRQRRKSLTDWKKQCIQGESIVALYLAHFLKLFRPPLGHLHRYLHGYLLAYFRIFCACVFLVCSCDKKL